jgi:hypothetical protein
MRNHVPHLDGIAAPLSFARVSTKNREFSSSITSSAFIGLKKTTSAGFPSPRYSTLSKEGGIARTGKCSKTLSKAASKNGFWGG